MKPVASASDTTIVQSVEYNEARAISAALVADLDRSLADNDLKLPSLPEVALKIRNALANEDVSVAEISRLIGSDPALAARIVKIANSALFYRGSKPITSVSAAVSQLGHRMVRNVALSYASQQVFIGYGSQSVREFLASIWQHSVHTRCARAHARACAHEAQSRRRVPRGAAARGREALHPDAGQGQDRAARERGRVPGSGRRMASAPRARRDRLLGAARGPRHRGRRASNLPLEAPEPPRLTDVVAVANYLAENSEAACADEHYFDKAPSLGSLAMDKPTFDWLIRAGDVDVRLLMIAFGV